MKRILGLAVPLIVLFLPGAGSCQSQPQPAYKPELIHFMIFVQIRHTKLWLAGDTGNWELADYEIDELKEVLENATKYAPDYKGMPVGTMIESVATAPIKDENAIKAKDRPSFVAAYDHLTAACNSCHESTSRRFVVIQRPSASVFPNQSFAPRRD